MNTANVQDVTPAEAWDRLQKQPQAVLLDVRSTLEYEYVGHPVGAVHVPWKEPPDWENDPQFVAKVKAALAERVEGEPEALPLMTLCRSGKRSRAAAEALMRQGFREVYNISEGFEGRLNEQGHRSSVNGWRFNKLPWEQA